MESTAAAPSNPPSAPTSVASGLGTTAPPTPTSVPPEPLAATPAQPVVIGTVGDGRARFLRTKQPRFELATVDGAEVALVVPSEGVRGSIQQLSLDVDGSGKIHPGNAAKRRALTIIAMVHTVIVDTTSGQKRPGAKIFADADLNVLVGEGSGPESVISLFGPKCEGVLDRSDAGIKEAAKNG